MNKNPTLLILLSTVLLSACGPNEADFKSVVPLTQRTEVTPKPSIPAPTPEPAPVTIEPPVTIADQINLGMPFFPQAPDGNWELPWQETCEEASITLAYHYATSKPISKNNFRQTLLDLVEWQKKNFGAYEHTTIEQTADMMRSFFGFTDLEIMENPSIQRMKEELSKGHVIIAPFAGRQLGNPFYSNEGPLYHMLVIKGYDDEHFITNDVGTRRGENFIYPQTVIMEALHDWNEADINAGAKRVIVVKLKD